MSPGSAFLQFWWNEKIRNNFLSHVPKDDLSSLRLACHDFSVRAAPLLFSEIDIAFRASIFTKPARMAALDRIGQHVKTMTFNFPHSAETFLAPLLDPVTGEEETFIYEPQVRPSRLSVPTYGSWEMTDLLVKQYSPLFHAAANVPSFISTFSAIPNLEHLKISCPGQEPSQRYRRSIVDYALISLRIAVERSPLKSLSTLSLLSVHPGVALYLNPFTSFGALPNSAKRWKQIRTLTIHMDGIPSHPTASADHLKLLHAYLHLFAPTLQHLSFRWLGQQQGPCPVSLPTSHLLRAPSPPLACPHTSHSPLKLLKFPRLLTLFAENLVVDARQIAAFITVHRRSLSEFNFDNTHLRTGSWDEALAPLTRISGSDHWKERSEEVMDVPLVLSPVGMEETLLKRVMREGGVMRKAWGGEKGRRKGGWGKEFWGGGEHMRRFLRASVFSWL